jgi:hypothetical protein
MKTMKTIILLLSLSLISYSLKGQELNIRPKIELKTPSFNCSQVFISPQTHENFDHLFSFVIQPSGKFTLSEESSYVIEKISGFLITQKPIDQLTWILVMNYNPSKQVDPQKPVTDFSMEELFIFIEKINKASDKFVYRLPTKIETLYFENAGPGGTIGTILNNKNKKEKINLQYLKNEKFKTFRLIQTKK